MDKTGSPDNNVRGKIPADIINPVVAYSLNRKLRYTYTGEYFKYRQASGGEYDYPSSTPNLAETVYVTKIYDQKAKYGVSPVDAIQQSESLQPTLTHDGTHYRANFTTGQFLALDGIASEISADVHIIFVGQGDYPRPAFGLWGASDNISVEPAYNARFTVNENHGSITDFSGRGVMTCFSGHHPASNDRVMYILTDGTYGDMTETASSATLTSAAIGRNDTRYFTGEVLELVVHLGDLTKRWGDDFNANTNAFYTNYN